MAHIFWIAIGGGLGAVGRYLVVSLVQIMVPDFRPFGTMVVNVLGCLFVGAIMAWIAKSNQTGSHLHLFLVTGILGGFTTFSAFGYETVSLIHEKQLNAAAINIAGNLIPGLVAVWLGLKCVEWVSR